MHSAHVQAARQIPRFTALGLGLPVRVWPHALWHLENVDITVRNYGIHEENTRGYDDVDLKYILFGFKVIS